ncbi:MAG: arginine--tRNA ligase [Bacteroidales bacterium]|nr:arginine--tRNA ligase [Bacteroidales bacterium]
MEKVLTDKVKEAIFSLYNYKVDEKQIQLQKTSKDFTGDITLVVFPFLRFSKKKPEETGEEIGNYLQENIKEISGFNTIKGFLNLEMDKKYWIESFRKMIEDPDFGIKKTGSENKTILVEFSSPNTNKPLHLGHIRNNLIGYSLSKIFEANGYVVKKVNIVNDRGIHICKSMLAWQKWGEGTTPEIAKKKGDKLVGDFYVRFEKEYKKQVQFLVENGADEDKAIMTAPLLKEAQAMLLKWEVGDKEVVDLWNRMNGWVYKGFDKTYEALGVSFDKIYYESDTYIKGKEIVLSALKNGVLFKKEDGSVWVDLSKEGLDEKILLRSDGTAVYMTQDLGTAYQRYDDYKFFRQIYVVGNEQNYHFQVLVLLLDKIGYKWAKDIYHLSYGMVELPEGKMKSREGTIVDADDLISEMIDTARDMSEELGKIDTYSEKQKEDIFRIIGLGALKYFILKVDPRKNMTFNPKESIDFNGNTGPFIQYTYARIKSVLRKAAEKNIKFQKKTDSCFEPNEKEIELIKILAGFPGVIRDAGIQMTTAMVANYCYELTKGFNQFYHDFSILNVDNDETRNFRLQLSEITGGIIEKSMGLLGIDVPERM